MTGAVTVAIPVRDGGARLAEVLAAVRAQRTERAVELLVCDSGSTDGSVARAREAGAHVLQIAPERFSHGSTRNLLMEQALTEHVVFLTQDAVPATGTWLDTLLGGFAKAEDVGLVFGPYEPVAQASLMVRRELTAWFDSFADDERPRVDRLSPDERELPALALLGRRAFFTDANGAVSREHWRRVPFRDVPYAEDHQLALDMLRAGFAKVYVPGAGVLHSHDYAPAQPVRPRVRRVARAARDLRLRRAAARAQRARQGARAGARRRAAAARRGRVAGGPGGGRRALGDPPRDPPRGRARRIAREPPAGAPARPPVARAT